MRTRLPDVPELFKGTMHWFVDWLMRQVPSTDSIVYTIWNRVGAFVYVGRAGRSTSTSSKS